jgi:hypothetical protein
VQRIAQVGKLAGPRVITAVTAIAVLSVRVRVPSPTIIVLRSRSRERERRRSLTADGRIAIACSATPA